MHFTHVYVIHIALENTHCRVGPKKYQKIARMYDLTGLSTKCTLIKTGFKNLRTGTEA